MVVLRIHGESTENIDEKEDKFLPQFPFDISRLILGQIFSSDPGALGVIRSVCKDWSSIPRPPTSLIDLGHHKSPYLVTLVDTTCKFFHPTYNHTFSVETPELSCAHIRFSKFGWLLLCLYLPHTKEFQHFFFNPLTREKRYLPNADNVEFAAMCFSSPPTSSEDCFVVGVSAYGFELALLKYGEERWIFFVLENPQRVRYSHPVFYKEKFYCLGENMKLIVLDVRTKRMIMIGKIFREKIDVERCHLVEDEDGMLGIFFVNRRKHPLVMSMDLSKTKKEWNVVPELKNKLVYVSPASSWSDLAPTRSTSNKIYFPFFQGSNNIFFSLHTNKYHSFDGNYTCGGIPCGVEKMTNCTWISMQ